MVMSERGLNHDKTRHVCAGWKSCVELGGGTESTSRDDSVSSVCWHKMCISRRCTREAVICPSDFMFNICMHSSTQKQDYASSPSSITAKLLVRDPEDEPRRHPQWHPCHHESTRVGEYTPTFLIMTCCASEPAFIFCWANVMRRHFCHLQYTSKHHDGDAVSKRALAASP